VSLGIQPFRLFVVDIMHDYEIRVFKMTLGQLIRILYSVRPEVVQELNRRQVVLGTLWCLELTRDA